MAGDALLTDRYRARFIFILFLVCFFNLADRTVFSVLASEVEFEPGTLVLHVNYQGDKLGTSTWQHEESIYALAETNLFRPTLPYLLADERTRQLLVEANQVDQQLYDFVANELYPTFQREYGPTLQADVAAYQASQRRSFDRLNLTLSRLKQFLVYRPLLYLNRRGLAFV